MKYYDKIKLTKYKAHYDLFCCWFASKHAFANLQHFVICNAYPSDQQELVKFYWILLFKDHHESSTTI